MNSGEESRKSCPIPDTHARLNQAFSLFRNVLEDYQDELRFTSVLNNLIQNLRNITFVMQKELAHHPGFEEWYSKVRDEMRGDISLKWLHDARNHVVKEGDLKKESYATVRLKHNFDHEIAAMKLNPTLSTEEIARDFCKKVPLAVPDNLLEQAVIEVERVWIVDNYPKTEVIDILIYCFGFLTDLVYRAHEELFEVSPLNCKENIHVDPSEDFMSILHNQIRRGRVTRVYYKTGEIIREHIGRMDRPSEKILKKASNHYGDMKHISSLMDKSGINIPFNNMRYHVEMAKHFFGIDGGLMPMAFLYFPDKEPMHIVLGLDDPATKSLVFEHLAEKIEETRCMALVIVAEGWSGDMPKPGEEYIPAYIQQKGEFISVLGVSPEKTQDYHMEIMRDENGVATLGEAQEMQSENYPVLDKIYRVWGVNKNSDAA